MGRLIVVSGPSGVGKGTVLKKLMEICEGLSFSVSATTRAPRPGEEHGREYYFVTKEAFEKMIADGTMLEYSSHAANYYGTPKGQMEEKRAYSDVLLDIEPVGAKQVKEKIPDALTFFLMPPSLEELERRLRGRGDTPENQIQMRMERALWEIEQRFFYDHILVNDDADRCAQELKRYIRGE